MNRRLVRLLLLLPACAALLRAQSFVAPDTQAVEEVRQQQFTSPTPSDDVAVTTPLTPQPAPRYAPGNPSPAPSPSPASSSPRGYSYTKEGLPIFGSQLFQGDFKNVSFNGFNPDYQVGIGDSVHVMLWGAQENSLDLKVDAQGNVFLPKIGPVQLLGVRNADLNRVITERIRQTYKENVEAYANLRSTQSVKVFASGAVMKPGLYQGFASDSVLYFLDRAGGIDPDRGSYLDVQVLRSGQPVAKLNLYDFLEKGVLPLTQFRDGDVILVGPRGNTLVVQGNVINPARFEFAGAEAPLDRILALASPRPDSTSVSIRRASGGNTQALTFPLDGVRGQNVRPGDAIDVTSHNVPKSILITLAGEFQGTQSLVLPYGAPLSAALGQIQTTDRSDLRSLQVFRKSIAVRQKALLNQSLDNLERNVLAAKSSTLEEAQLRKAESETMLAFIKRARDVEPKGQVLLESLDKANDLRLEDGDILYVPAKSSLVTVYGEVRFPNTQTWRARESISKYIARAGGFTQSADTKELIVIQPNGGLYPVGTGGSTTIQPGDEIIVLPKPDKKTFLFAKDISTIIYQIAIAARVVIGL